MHERGDTLGHRRRVPAAHLVQAMRGTGDRQIFNLRKPRMEHLPAFVEHREAFASDHVQDGLGNGARSLHVEFPLGKGWQLDLEERPDVPLCLFGTAGNGLREGALPVRRDHVAREVSSCSLAQNFTAVVPWRRWRRGGEGAVCN